MNKIKLFIASMLGAIALVFACVLGTRVNAATLTETYDFDITSYVDDADNKVINIVDGHQGTLTATGTNDNSKEMNLIISAETVGSNGIYYSTGNKDLRITKTSTAANLRFSFKFTTEGDATLSFKFNSSGGSKNVEYWVDDAKSATGTFAAGSLTAKSISITGAGDHTISWHGTSTTTSDVKFSDLSILDHYEKDVKTYDVTLNYSITGVDNVVTPIEENSKYTLPEPSNKLGGSTFNGWKSSLNDTIYNAGTEIEITEAVTFTAQWKANELGSGRFFDVSNVEAGTYSNDCVMIDGTIFTTYATSEKSVSIETTSITGANNESFTKRMALGGKSSVSGTLARCIGFIAPGDGIIKVQFVTGSNGKSRSAQIFDASSTSTALATASNSTSTTATEFSCEAKKGKSYLVGSNTDTIVLLSVRFEQIADSVTLAFDAQYDKADATAATKLRFIGTITGLATTEYTKIESITFTFDFAFRNQDDRACEVTQLYLSITTDGNEYAAASNKMYFVYQLDSINQTDYAKKELTDCKLTVLFTDGSSKTVKHDDITLPAFA